MDLRKNLKSEEVDGFLPNEIAFENAEKYLKLFQDDDCLPVYQIVPSVVGGIGLTIRSKKRKVYVEFNNQGNVCVLFSDGEAKPMVEKVFANNIGFVAGKAKAYLSTG